MLDYCFAENEKIHSEGNSDSSRHIKIGKIILWFQVKGFLRKPEKRLILICQDKNLNDVLLYITSVMIPNNV